MLASKISAHEDRFESRKSDSSGTKYKLENKVLQGITVREATPYKIDDYYYDNTFEKQGIVMHFTVGYLRGDMAALVRQGKHVSVPYVLSRGGTPYQLWDPKGSWSYHLGRGAVGGNGYLSKRTIALEISNIGPLTKKGSNLYTAYGDRYCTLAEAQYYTELDKPWRGYDYYASFTDDQYETLINLLKYLTNRFKIPTDFLPIETRYKVFGSTKSARAFKGISTHVNYRSSGKWDLGPAFDWDRVIEGVQPTKVPAKVPATKKAVKKVVKKAPKIDVDEQAVIPKAKPQAYRISTSAPSGGIMGFIQMILNLLR